MGGGIGGIGGGMGGGAMGGMSGAGKMGMPQTQSVSQTNNEAALLLIQKKKHKGEDKSFEAMLINLNKNVQSTQGVQNTKKVEATQSAAKMGGIGTKVNKFV